MQTPHLEISPNSDSPLNKISVNLDALPYPTVIYVVTQKDIYLNQHAYKCLGMKKTDRFDLNHWNKINPRTLEIAARIDKPIMMDQKVMITLFNGKKEIISFNLSLVRTISLGDIYFIHFSKASEKFSVTSLSSLYAIKDEIKKLNPYLNNTGKALLAEFMNKYYPDNQNELMFEDLVYYEKELQILQNAFPFLSNSEIIICSLLINDLDNNEIAELTKKSMNSMFVTIHRLNKKLGVENRHKLIMKLRSLVENHKSNRPVIIEEFDI